jgi:hypothetical protein
MSDVRCRRSTRSRRRRWGDATLTRSSSYAASRAPVRGSPRSLGFSVAGTTRASRRARPRRAPVLTRSGRARAWRL